MCGSLQALSNALYPCEIRQETFTLSKLEHNAKAWRTDVGVGNRDGTLDPTLWDFGATSGSGKFLYAWRFRLHAPAPHWREVESVLAKKISLAPEHRIRSTHSYDL
jgi:hypothetical protein